MLPHNLSSNLRPQDLTKLEKELTLGWGNIFARSLPSRDELLALAVKNYLKVNIKVFHQCPQLGLNFNEF